MRHDGMLFPEINELPSNYAHRLGQQYASQTALSYKKKHGQFFTPKDISDFMASFIVCHNNFVSILDPGCGVGILSCSAIEAIVNKSGIKNIRLKAYETDSNVISFAKITYSYLQNWLSSKSISFDFSIHNTDFILDNSKLLETKDDDDKFDFVIANPPYFKLSKNDIRTQSTSKIVSGQPNIYALFLGISAKLLSPDGQLIFIIPRSFTSGNYFKSFRFFFFEEIQIKRVHLFDSRKDTFKNDKVLQETMILYGCNSNVKTDQTIVISSSNNLKDLKNARIRVYNRNHLIDESAKEKVFHIPVNDNEDNVLNLVKTWTNCLMDFGIHVSTGPVVAFRAVSFIKLEKPIAEGPLVAPLFWLNNVRKMELSWPLMIKGKGQYISVEDKSKSLLVKKNNYVLLRRFSTKDDKSRLIAAPFFNEYITGDWIGIENKVNYIYKKNSCLQTDEVFGLCALLNSWLYDTYFQMFNGNVNVSATEIREMRFPSYKEIVRIGAIIQKGKNTDMEFVDRVISEILNIEQVAYE